MWKIKFDNFAIKKLQKLDKTTRQQIEAFINQKLKVNPTLYSSLLVGNQNKLSRARVGDYRIIFAMRNRELIILVLDIEHRSKIYKK